MNGYAVRITRPYDTLRATLLAWRPLCNQIILYQHEDDVNRIHVHLLIIEPTHCVRSFKDKSGIDNGGNSLWSFKSIKEEGFPKYICYMSKGIYDPKYTDGRILEYTLEQIEEFKKGWVNKIRTPRVSPGTQKWLDFKEHMEADATWNALKISLFDEAIYGNLIGQIAKRYCINKYNGHWNQQCQNEIVSYTRSFLWDYKVKNNI